MKIKITLKKIIEFICFITIISIITTTIQEVKAGTNDSTLTREKIDGYYSLVNLSDGTHLYNLEKYTLNGKIAYCIEVGKKITGTIYNSTTNEAEILKQANITKEKLEKIKLYTYFGYGYSTQVDIKYYMATQELIWEELTNYEVNWTQELNKNGKKIDIEFYKKHIKTLAANYNNDFSFSSTINCKIGQSISYLDTTGNLRNYEVSDPGRQEVQKTSSRIKIDINENYIGKDVIKLTSAKLFKYQNTLFTLTDSQTMFSTGDIEMKPREITLNISGETLTTNLVDKDTKKNIPQGQASLIGAKYEIYDKNNKLIKTITTDKTLTNQIKDLYHDIYYIKQIKASTGYKINDEIIEVDLSKTTSITLEEEVIKSTVRINKLYKNKEQYFKEANITFNIYDNKNNLYKTITTDKYADTDIILPYGNYTIKQQNTTEGYKFVDDINLKINSESSPIIRYDLIDEQIKLNLKIITKDKETQNKIEESDITYKIKEQSSNKYLSYKDINNKKQTKFHTDSKGELLLPFEISYGTYLIEQVTPPNNYLEDNEPLKITINNSSNFQITKDTITLEVDYYNEPIKGQLNIITNKESIEDTKMQIRPNVDIDIYYNEEFKESTKTDSEGKLELSNLPLGKYCVKEKNSKLEKCVDLTTNSNNIKIVKKEIELTEKISTSELIIINKDDKSNPIKETTFELYKEDNLIKEVKTDDKGQATIQKLLPGNYCLKQTKISNNYILNKAKICFSIKETDKALKINVINKQNSPKKFQIPNTLSNTSYLIPILILIINILLLVGVYYKKMFSHKY